MPTCVPPGVLHRRQVFEMGCATCCAAACATSYTAAKFEWILEWTSHSSGLVPLGIDADSPMGRREGRRWYQCLSGLVKHVWPVCQTFFVPVWSNISKVWSNISEVWSNIFEVWSNIFEVWSNISEVCSFSRYTHKGRFSGSNLAVFSDNNRAG